MRGTAPAVPLMRVEPDISFESFEKCRIKGNIFKDRRKIVRVQTIPGRSARERTALWASLTAGEMAPVRVCRQEKKRPTAK